MTRRVFLLLLLLLSLSGCANLARQAGQRMAADLSAVMQDHTDPDTVAEAMPAYLLLLDALVRQNPQSADTLFSASRLYATYGGNFVQNPRRAATLTERARAYADRAFCLQWQPWCQRDPAQLSALIESLKTLPVRQLDALYQTATAWTAWAQTHTDDWNAVAEIPLIQAMFARVEALDAQYDHGRLQLYLAVLNTLLPPAYGGQPEVARAYFEKAMQLSQGRDLMVPALYARHYARLVFDQSLHDRLLKQVLSADPRQPGLTLSNLLAQRQARRWLQESNDYF